MKHKVIKDFQFVSPEKKIFILKSGVLIENYKYVNKNDSITIDRDIIDNNPDFFLPIDWKSEIITYLKNQKIQSPSIVGRKIIPFIDDLLIVKSSDANIDDIEDRKKILDKRESSLKEEMNYLSHREEKIKNLIHDMQIRESSLDKKEKELREKERNLDIASIKGTDEIDSKQKEMMDKIESEIKELSLKEEYLSSKMNEVNKLEEQLHQRERKLKETKTCSINHPDCALRATSI